MVQVHGLTTPGNHTGMPGDFDTAVENDNLRRSERDPYLPPDQAGGDGVLCHPHRDEARPVDPRGERQSRVEAVLWQGSEQRLLNAEILADRPYPGVDPTGLVSLVPGDQPFVQLRERVHLGHRREAVATESADLALDTALLVSAPNSGLAVERVEPVVGTEQHPPVVLVPAPTEQYFRHRRGQIVVPDMSCWDPADRVECLDMPLEERLLGLGGIDPVDSLSRMGEPEDEHVALRLHPGKDNPDISKIDLGFSTRCVALRDKRIHPPAPLLNLDLDPPDTDVVPHRGIGQLRGAMFLSEPGQNPGRRMTLLPRSIQIRPQHLIDRLPERCQPGRHPNLDLPR